MIKKLLTSLAFPILCSAANIPNIVGGAVVAERSPIAQQTVLIVGKLYNRSTFYCTGTVLNKNMILTAAHCLGGNLWADLVVHFKTKVDGPGKTAKVIDRRTALDHIPSGQTYDWNDVAVVKIEGQIPENYIPVTLPTENFISNGDPVLLAGYGTTQPLPVEGDDNSVGTLRWVEQNILQSQYGTSEILVDIRGKGSCRGDSGGPAFYVKQGKMIQIGITSRLTDRDIIPGPKKNYGCTVDIVYTSTLAFSTWIQNAIKEMNPKLIVD